MRLIAPCKLRIICKNQCLVPTREMFNAGAENVQCGCGKVYLLTVSSKYLCVTFLLCLVHGVGI